MNDAENLSKLLGHLPPAVFREFMVEEFELTMPALDKKQTKRDQRAEMETVLSGLDINHRQRIEEVAERIVLLSDGAGQDVIEGFRETSSIQKSRKHLLRLATSTSAHCGCTSMRRPCLMKR